MRNLIWKGTVSIAALSLSVSAAAAPHSGASAPEPGQVKTKMLVEATEEDAAPVQSLSHQGATDSGRFQGQSVALKRDVTLLLEEQTEYKVRHTASLPVGPRGARVPVETIQVQSGRADAQIPDGAAQGVLFESRGNVQAISIGGRLAIVANSSSVSIATLEGDALVGQKGRFKPLQAGRIRHYDLRTGIVSDRALLPAPQAETKGLGVALSGGAEVKIQSTRVAGAKKYRAMLLRSDGTLAGPWVESESPQGLAAHVEQAGTYWAVVLAVDEFGFAGQASPPQPTQVLGLSNSSEVVRHGMIFLGPGQSAHIVGQRGLVMRYGTSPEFIPAPSSISLPGRKATTVEFRDPTDPHRFAVFKLAPRLLKTRILVGPAMSVWPRDNVDISVRMWDGHGHPLSWMDDYRLIVKVGVNEVPVDWARGNGELTTVLPPQTGAGPWVVRVSVLDPTGAEIGRNFLEIAPPPAPK